jgi:hypothetical protein
MQDKKVVFDCILYFSLAAFPLAVKKTSYGNLEKMSWQNHSLTKVDTAAPMCHAPPGHRVTTARGSARNLPGPNLHLLIARRSF